MTNEQGVPNTCTLVLDIQKKQIDCIISNTGAMIHRYLIYVVTTSITEKVKYLHHNPLKIQTNVYIREASSFFTVSAFINIFSTSGISELIQKNRWGR